MKRKINMIVYAVFGILILILSIALVVMGFVYKNEASRSCVAMGFMGIFSSIICYIMFSHYKKSTNEEVESEERERQQRIMESLVILHYDNEVLACPHCGSTQILYHTKKFSTTKGVMGGLVFGYPGIAFGVPNNKRIKCKCQICGHKFEVIMK